MPGNFYSSTFLVDRKESMVKIQNENRNFERPEKHLVIDGHDVTIRFADTEMPETFWRIRDILLNTISFDSADFGLDIAG